MKPFLRGASVVLDFGLTWPIRLLIISGILTKCLIVDGVEFTGEVCQDSFAKIKQGWIRKIQWIKDGTPE